MKINFIRNLSDEVLKQNHQLKTDIIVLKQKVTNYEERMMAMLTEIKPDTPIMSTPEQTLMDFIKVIREELKEFHAKKIEGEKKDREIERMGKKVYSLEGEIVDKERELSIKSKKWESVLSEMTLTQCKNKEDVTRLEKAHQSILAQLIETRQKHARQVLLQEELRRQEVEETRQFHYREFLAFRERSEKEFIFLEKALKQEIAQKDKTVKDLEKTIEKLSSNIKIDEQESQILRKLLSSFQEYNHLTQQIQELRDETIILKQECQQANKTKLMLQSKMKQVKTTEQNLQSHISRLTLEKNELDNKFKVKIKEIEKSEKDKDAMEAYYDKKWNSEIKKVKFQLEKSYMQKIKGIEEDCQAKLQQMNETVHLIQQRIEACEKKEKQLLERYEDDQIAKAKLNEEIGILQVDLKIKERDMLSMEDLLRRQIAYNLESYKESQRIYCDQIKLLKENIKQSQLDLDQQQILSKKKLENIQKDYEFKISSMLQDHEIDKVTLDKKYRKEINDLKNELEKKYDFLADIRKEIELQFQDKLAMAQKEFEHRVKERQEEGLKKLEKLTVKYRELEAKMAQTKKKSDEDHYFFEKETTKLERQIEKLKKSEALHEGEVKSFLMEKNELLIKLGKLQTSLKEAELQIADREEDITQLKSDLNISYAEMNQLVESRKQWLKQITNLQKSYESEFDGLRKINEKQINLYKSRIWELEEMVRKRAISKKDYEKIQQLNNERKQLRNTIHIKEAENIILNQVKDYYQIKLREVELKGEPKTAHGESKPAHLILSRRYKRKVSDKTSITQVIEPKQVTQMKRYIINSNKKYQNQSLSKSKFDEYTRHHRFNTTTG